MLTGFYCSTFMCRRHCQYINNTVLSQ